MSFIKKFVEKSVISRREFLLKSALGIGGMAALPLISPLSKAMAAEGGNFTLAWGYRDPDNSYWNAIAAGGQSYAKSQNSPMVSLINRGNNEKVLSYIKALLSKTEGKLAIGCDPNDAPNARAVVTACQQRGAFITTIWNKTEDLHPWDFGDNYVAHISWSDFEPAQQCAQLLFDAMGKKGGIVGLGGIASNVPASERKAGLMHKLKENPDIKLLDWQDADWSTSKANDMMSTMLTRFGDDIKGIFSSNDSMTLGIIEALRAEGLAGQIPIVSYDGTPDAVKLCISGEILCTVSTDPYWAGGIALSLAHHAAIGSFKPSAEPHEHREFYGPTIMITKDDAQKWYQENIVNTPVVDWNNFWQASKGPIQYRKL